MCLEQCYRTLETSYDSRFDDPAAESCLRILYRQTTSFTAFPAVPQSVVTAAHELYNKIETVFVNKTSSLYARTQRGLHDEEVLKNKEQSITQTPFIQHCWNVLHDPKLAFDINDANHVLQVFTRIMTTKGANTVPAANTVRDAATTVHPAASTLWVPGTQKRRQFTHPLPRKTLKDCDVTSDHEFKIFLKRFYPTVNLDKMQHIPKTAIAIYKLRYLSAFLRAVKEYKLIDEDNNEAANSDAIQSFKDTQFAKDTRGREVLFRVAGRMDCALLTSTAKELFVPSVGKELSVHLNSLFVPSMPHERRAESLSNDLFVPTMPHERRAESLANDLFVPSMPHERVSVVYE